MQRLLSKNGIYVKWDAEWQKHRCGRAGCGPSSVTLDKPLTFWEHLENGLMTPPAELLGPGGHLEQG